jgi:DNA polymerase-3 subunit gamma/tau
MSYQVLARRWRPRNFQALAGQEHVVRALVNALDQQRLHHAYLFTGTRGVGKTTIARIFAKSLNCEQGVSSVPCGVCGACQDIDAGRFIDLIEVDAASRTKVEDTRELLENVQYAPTAGRYKVYLIDEVHMLSTHSFNALLKTLEEPPPHIKFLLATTDPQKLPVTVLSRCLQFNLKRMPPPLIASYLERILEKEQITCDQGALRQLAQAADGSMRDALSLLDQAIAFGNGEVHGDDVECMLGSVSRDRILELLEGLASDNAGAVLATVAHLAEVGADFESVLADLLTLLHELAIIGTVPETLPEFDTDRERLKRLAARMTGEDTQLFYQIGLMGRRDLPMAPDTRTGIEMILLRMLAFRPAPAPTASAGPDGRRGDLGDDGRRELRPLDQQPLAQEPLGQAAEAPCEAVSPANRPSAFATDASEEKAQLAKVPVAEQQSRAALSSSVDWEQIVASLKLRGMPRELASNCSLRRRAGNHFYLDLPLDHENLRMPNFEARLREALAERFGASVKLTISVGKPEIETPAQRRSRLLDEQRQEARRAIESDPVVIALKDKFNAQIRTDSIRPVEQNTQSESSDT